MHWSSKRYMVRHLMHPSPWRSFKIHKNWGKYIGFQSNVWFRAISVQFRMASVLRVRFLDMAWLPLEFKFQVITTLHDPKEILFTTILHIASLSMKNTLLMNMGLLLFNTKSKKNMTHEMVLIDKKAKRKRQWLLHPLQFFCLTKTLTTQWLGLAKVHKKLSLSDLNATC